MPDRQPRRTQEERSESTQRLLLEATLDSLIELGYAKSTTQRIADKAGLTRGAQLHHYPNKQDLVVAATDFLFKSFIDDVEVLAKSMRGNELDLDGFIEGVWERFFAGRFFYASLELIVAARSDATLKQSLAPLIRELHRGLDEIWNRYFRRTGLSAARIDTLLNLTLCLFRGMAVQAVLREDPAYYRELVNAWKDILPKLVTEEDSNTKGSDADSFLQITVGEELPEK